MMTALFNIDAPQAYISTQERQGREHMSPPEFIAEVYSGKPWVYDDVERVWIVLDEPGIFIVIRPDLSLFVRKVRPGKAH